MTLKARVTRLVMTVMLERPAQRQGLTKLAQNLNDSGEAFYRDLERIEENERNREQLRHIIAIERWGQRRVAVALGEAFIQDDNHADRKSVV